MISKPISKQPRAIETIVLLSAWIIGNLWTYLWFLQSLRYTSQLNLVILGLGFTALIVQLIRSNLQYLRQIKKTKLGTKSRGLL